MSIPGSVASRAVCFVATLVLGWTPVSAAGNLVVYGDGLAKGWANWSWSATTNPAVTSPVHSGTHSMSVKITGAWGALYLHADPAADLTSYNRVTFWIRGGATGDAQLDLVVNKDNSHAVPVTATANSWKKVDVLLSDLGSPAAISDIYLIDATGAAQPIFYVDDFAIVNESGASPTIYQDALGRGWDNWSWGANVGLTATAPVHAGTHSTSVQITDAWGALYLHADPSAALNNYDGLSFWVHGGATGGQQLNVTVNGDNTHAVPVRPAANEWTNVVVPFADLGSPTGISAIYLIDAKGGAQPVIYVDDIAMVVTPPVSGPALKINTSLGRHAISEDIYGMNFPDEELASELKLPVNRWGGNSTTRYNWQNDTFNVASDWYFENIPQENPNPSTLPDGSAADRFVEQNVRTGTKSLVTIPMIGWTPKRRLSNHPYDCGFKVSKYGAQQSTDPWDPDCGNGKHTDGSNVTGNDPKDTSVAIGPPFVKSWVQHLTKKYGTAASGGVTYYNLDNEPTIWDYTHRDVHPKPVGYEEMKTRTYEYAAAIKAVDPSAKILGPVFDSWCRYLYSGLDGCQAGSDYQHHGNLPIVAWYLRQMKAYQAQHGVRILDYFDLHYYPGANGVALSPAGDSSTRALRLRSTRSLWDPTYIDESWISDTEPGGVAVQMIPRMKSWVQANYPGTKLAITEYNWGAPEDINGALAQADVLGIFGGEGLDLATLWGSPETTQPAAFAFRMYRNYDGSGAVFGDVGVSAVSTNQGLLSVYAAQRNADKAVTVMVINKTGSTLVSTVSLAGFAPQPNAKVFRYGAAKPSLIESLPDLSVRAGSIKATFAPSSITLLLIKPVS